jgi:hypothetical protein
MSEWHPIKTAPKDGTLILGYGEPLDSGAPRFGLVAWVAAVTEWWEQTSPTTKELRVEEGGHWDGDVIPDYWMLLPDPPTE